MNRTTAVLSSILLFIILAPSVSGYVEEFRWHEKTSHTMLWGDRIIIAGHTIEFRDFSSQSCIFYIYCNNTFEEEAFVTVNSSLSNNWEHDDLFRIRLDSMNSEAEEARITTWVGQVVVLDIPPKLEVSISNEHAAAGRNFYLLVDVTNLANQSFNNVSVILNPGDFEIEESTLNPTIMKLKANTTKTLMFKVTAPGILEARNYTVNVTASGWIDRAYHQIDVYKNINVGSVVLTKHIYPVYIVLNSEHNYATVTLSLINPSSMEVSAYIEDVILPGFKPQSGNQIKSWFITIAPDSTEMIQYRAIATKNGDYIFPMARAWLTSGDEHDLIYSKQIYHNGSIEVHGSAVILNKTVNRTVRSAGDFATVNLTIRNIGDKTAFVWVNDTLPDGVELIYGEIEWEGILQSMQYYELSYVIRLTKDIDELILPTTNVGFIDSKKNIGSAESNEVLLAANRTINTTGMNTWSEITDANMSQTLDNVIENFEKSQNSQNNTCTPGNMTNGTVVTGWNMTVSHIPGFDIITVLIGFLIGLCVRRCTRL